MKNQMNAVKQAIKSYLDNRAKTDELFAVAYAKQNKNIDECFNYILGEARKLGNAVYLPDEVVFGWAVHYYDEDNIKVKKLPQDTKVTTSAGIELSAEDKEKAREIALDEYKQQCKLAGNSMLSACCITSFEIYFAMSKQKQNTQQNIN